LAKHIRCNLCGSNHYVVQYKAPFSQEGKDYSITDYNVGPSNRIVKCVKCGLIYINPRQEGKELLSSYINMADDLYVQEEKGRRISSRVILKKLNRLKKRGRILDVGCATGFFLDEAKGLGWEVYGVELSKWAVSYARDKFDIEVFEGELKDAHFQDSYFDVVVLKDSIEHLIDPKATLNEIRRILKQDGILYINTPNISSLASRILKARWWGLKQFHLYYFTKGTLSRMLDVTGFNPLKWKSYSRTFTFSYWIDRFKTYNFALYKILDFLSSHLFLRDKMLTINFGDQIEVYARKSRKLKYIDELERRVAPIDRKEGKVIVVLPAYNAAKTLYRTVNDIPKDIVDEIILVDDKSGDNTVEVAKNLGLKVFTHDNNRGYGGNQKTCFTKALEADAEIVIMVHPDYQYDPKVIPELIEPIRSGRVDAVFGSRMMKGGALEGGMPLWKHNANILLTALENVVLGTYLTEYHSGFRAYSARLLKSVRFNDNSDGFIFDTEIIVQILIHNFKIEEIPVRTRYFDEASTITLWPSIIYGLGILKTLLKYYLHTHVLRFREFE
jgi:SAM-dependent methyltransferase